MLFFLILSYANYILCYVGYAQFPFQCCPEGDGIVAEPDFFGSLKYDYDNSFFMRDFLNNGRLTTHVCFIDVISHLIMIDDR